MKKLLYLVTALVALFLGVNDLLYSAGELEEDLLHSAEELEEVITCDSDSDCVDGLVCLPDDGENWISENWICRPRQGAGDSCFAFDSACVDGLVCLPDDGGNWICTPRQGAGGYCFGDSDCVDGLHCSENACGTFINCPFTKYSSRIENDYRVECGYKWVHDDDNTCTPPPAGWRLVYAFVHKEGYYICDYEYNK